MNKQSNIYTIIYIIVMVVVVGAALALTSISLKDRRQANADADKMSQILASVDIRNVPADEIKNTYNSVVTETFVINDKGEIIDNAPEAFDIDIAVQSKEQASQRLLPVYRCTLSDGATKYVMPMYGAGLWGPIWGYVSVNADGRSVYGAYFAHQGETPGLGAEIEKPAFSNRFAGKRLLVNGKFAPIAIIKSGMNAPQNCDYVDGISGGTITSKGVGAMIDNCLSPYASFLDSLASKNSTQNLDSHVE